MATARTATALLACVFAACWPQLAPTATGWLSAAAAGACGVLAAVSWGLLRKTRRGDPENPHQPEQQRMWRMFSVLASLYVVLALGFLAYALFGIDSPAHTRMGLSRAASGIGRAGSGYLAWLFVVLITWGTLLPPLLISEYMIANAHGAGPDSGFTVRYEQWFARQRQVRYQSWALNKRLRVRLLLWLQVYLWFTLRFSYVLDSWRQRQWNNLSQDLMAWVVVAALPANLVWLAVNRLWRPDQPVPQWKFISVELAAVWIAFLAFVLSMRALPLDPVRRRKYLGSIALVLLYVLMAALDLGAGIHRLAPLLELLDPLLASLTAHTHGLLPWAWICMAALTNLEFFRLWSRRVDDVSAAIENHHRDMLVRAGASDMGARLLHVISNRLVAVNGAFSATNLLARRWLDAQVNTAATGNAALRPEHIHALREQLQAGQAALTALHDQLGQMKGAQRLAPRQWLDLRRELTILADRHGGHLQLTWSADLSGPDAERLELHVSRDSLADILSQLIENTSAAAGEAWHAELQVSWAPQGTHPRPLWLVLTDNGPGFDAETKARVFEAFYSTKTTGSGMGCYLAQEQVRSLGGRLLACSPRAGDAWLHPPTNPQCQGAQFVVEWPDNITRVGGE